MRLGLRQADIVFWLKIQWKSYLKLRQENISSSLFDGISIFFMTNLIKSMVNGQSLKTF